MHVKVFHDDTARFEPVRLVATVNIPADCTKVHSALEYAWRWTNNVGGSWSRKIGADANDNVHVHVTRADGRGLRSTMVGDMMEYHDDEGNIVGYGVAGVGFKKLI